MKLGIMAASVGLVACASIARGAQFAVNQHTTPDATFVVVSGGGTCPAGTKQLYAGSSVIFRNAGNGNLTEDTRCWQTPPESTAQVEVAVLGPCIVCRFGR
jgi:hypothetical protein